MKIAVQGILIETDNIYAITEIKKHKKEYDFFDFKICFLNRKIITFSTFIPGIIYKTKDEKGKYKYYLSETENGYTDDPDFINNHPVTKEAKESLEYLRNYVIQKWSENQSSIPSIKIDSSKIYINGLGD